MPVHPVQYLLIENLVFLAVSTLFLGVTGYAWRHLKPFTLPDAVPGWFFWWFGSVQVLGGILPAGVLGWGIWSRNVPALLTLAPLTVILALQVLAESLTLRRTASVIWVMVPYLYLPYRLWQIGEGWLWLDDKTSWLAWLLVFEFGVWLINYLLDLAQLPHLFQWPSV